LATAQWIYHEVHEEHEEGEAGGGHESGTAFGGAVGDQGSTPPHQAE
jgi:hypothetical protein